MKKSEAEDTEMKSNYFLGNGQFQLREEAMPVPGDRDVLVRVAACGICGTDVHIFHGDQGSAEVTPPVVLGHEFAGTVEAVGRDVRSLRPGDHVTVDPTIYCGACPYCRKGKKQLCTSLFAIGVNRNGGFSEYCAVPAEQCFLLDPAIPLRFGAMTEPLACCIHGIDRAGIRPGDTVLIIGCGAIGLMMLQLARLQGASGIIVSEPVAMRREIALKLGADAAIDPVHESVADAVRKGFGGLEPDVVIECVGNTVAVRQAFEAAGRGSTLLLFSVPVPGTAHPLSLMDVYKKELTVTGSMINPDTHARAAALINAGRIRFDEIITHTYPLEQLQDALLMQMNDASIKVIVEPGAAE